MLCKTLLLTLIPVVSAHFKLDYPTWRGEALETEDPTISEWFYPCEYPVSTMIIC
jgi:hypothetical protein